MAASLHDHGGECTVGMIPTCMCSAGSHLQMPAAHGTSVRTECWRGEARESRRHAWRGEAYSSYARAVKQASYARLRPATSEEGRLLAHRV